MIIQLTLFIDGKQETIKVKSYETFLNLCARHITSLKGTIFPPNLTELIIFDNKLGTLEWLPPNLTILYISGNQIKSLVSPQGERLLPPSLIELSIPNNQIETIEGLSSNLTKLSIWNNRIKLLEGLPTNLTALDISNNQITSLEGLPPNLETLNISFNQIKSLISPQGEALLPPNLNKLIIHSNQIKSLKGLPPNLTYLNISHNQIESLIGLPPNLTYLNISKNQIKSLVSPQGEMLLPPNLTKIDISRNQIKSLEGLPSNLATLDIYSNQIKSLEGLPPNLTTLDISVNQLKSLEGLTRNLTELYISDNLIKSLVSPQGEMLLPLTLTKLSISNNQIETLEGLPPSLTSLYISNNHIETLPIEIVHMRNLRDFSYFGNPFENIHPSVQRFLTSLENRNTRSGNTIYDDGQNVHNAIVQSSIRESLNSLTKYNQLVTESKLPLEETSFLDDQEVHSYFHFTQKETLLFVENAIEVGGYSTEVKEELYSLLKEAIIEGKQVCSTGRIGRMVNVLSGFDPNVQIKISDNAQIGAIVSSFRERGETKDSVAEELRSRGIKKEEIDKWLEYY